MAITFTNIGVNAAPDVTSATDASSYATASWTPPTGLIILHVHSKNASGLHACTVSGNGLTWVEVKTEGYDPSAGTDRGRLTAFLADNSSGTATAGATTVSFGGNTQTRGDLRFMKADGVDLTGGVAAAVVQAVSNKHGNTGVAGLDIALAAAGHADNRVVACFAHTINERATHRANWTEMDDAGGNTPAHNVQTQVRGDAFETTASATWATTTASCVGIALELKALVAGGGGNTYNDSVSLSRKETASDLANVGALARTSLGRGLGVSDRGNLIIFPTTSLGRGLGVSDGATSDIGRQVEIDRITGVNNSTAVGAFSVVDLQRVLSFLSGASASIEASIPLLRDLGLDPENTGNLDASSAFHKVLGLNLGGGLNFILETTLSRVLGITLSSSFDILAQTSLGKSLGFLPANIALIGGDVEVGKSLGLIDVPNLDAVADTSLSKTLSLSDAANLTVNAVVNLSEKFVVIFDEEVGVSAIVLILQTLSESLGIGTSAQLDSHPQVGIEVHEGIDGTNTALLNTDMGLGIEYSIVTVGDLNVIIVKGFVVASDAVKNSILVSNALKSLLSSTNAAKSSSSTSDAQKSGLDVSEDQKNSAETGDS